MSTRLAAAVELLRRRGDLTVTPRPDQRIAVAYDECAELPKTAIALAELPVAPWSLEHTVIAAGIVRDGDDAARAVIAASRGASVLIALAPSIAADERAELIDALARIGPVERLDSVPVVPTDETMRSALRALAGGGTVAEAAYEVHMSERTLHRRLSRLRAQLGVNSNVAAARDVLGTPD
jgi:DNA-binding transcriptional LysR family regulator